MADTYRAGLERALRALCRGADAVCDGIGEGGGVPRLNPMTGGYN